MVKEDNMAHLKLTQRELDRLLGEACLKRDLDKARLAIVAGANADEPNGWCISTAARLGDKDMIQLLIDEGANVNAQSSNDLRTALHYAVKNGATEIVRVLLDSGANTNVAESTGFTPIDLAHQLGNHELIALLKKAADKHKVGSDPIHKLLNRRAGQQDHTARLTEDRDDTGQKYVGDL
ncbi:MAG TPA: ankyrin repeat domain-containing protein [Pirellulales bacterium]|jgi:ankyrin repeat protein